MFERQLLRFFDACNCRVKSKKSAKVLPHDEGQEMGLMRSSKAKKGRSSPDSQ